MLCQNCGKNEVTFRYTQVVNGVKKEMNLCDNCASELGLKDINFSMPISFSSFLSDFFNDYSDSILPSFIGTRQLQCDSCGTTFDDFLNTGVFGCDECYDTFEDRIEPLIRKIQGSNKHIGRGYKNDDPKSKVNTGSNKKVEIKEKNDEDKTKSKLDILQKDLQKAIKDERYEDAAKIRDEIKEIENKENKNTKNNKSANKKDEKENKNED